MKRLLNSKGMGLKRVNIFILIMFFILPVFLTVMAGCAGNSMNKTTQAPVSSAPPATSATVAEKPAVDSQPMVMPGTGAKQTTSSENREQAGDKFQNIASDEKRRAKGEAEDHSSRQENLSKSQPKKDAPQEGVMGGSGTEGMDMKYSAPSSSEPMSLGGISVDKRKKAENKLAMNQPGAPPLPATPTQPTPPGNEQVTHDAMFFKNHGVNPLVDTEEDHLSTFAIDVDTASYSLCRNYLNNNQLPPASAVRTEEFINYFKYGYPSPQQKPFEIYLEGTKTGFDPSCQMMRVAIQGKQVPKKERKSAYLVFVIDCSGSMRRTNRMGMVKESLKLLIEQLRQGDRIGIVAYNTSAWTVLDPTGLENKEKIISAIESLSPGGSTNAEAGILQGYQMMGENFGKDRINRVILCTDGVANVGPTGPEAILKTIQDYKNQGIYLSCIGVGMGNYNDALMEKLADQGNGNYFYVDDIKEAKKVFVENLTGTLQTVAKDVKIQVDFNPNVVQQYRLLGYENRDVADDKFRDDKEDGGEVGAGHSVTALYELKMTPNRQGKIATVYVRYKDPENYNKVAEVNKSIATSQLKNGFHETSDSFKLAASVAEYSEILKDSYWAKNGDLNSVLNVIEDLSPNIREQPEVEELVQLIHKTKTLKGKG